VCGLYCQHKDGNRTDKKCREVGRSEMWSRSNKLHNIEKYDTEFNAYACMLVWLAESSVLLQVQGH
jgi:hypothetical protein